MIAMGKLVQFDADTTFTAWMGQIVRNVALNHARHVRRRAPSVDPHALEAHVGDDLHHQAAPVSGGGTLVTEQEVFDDRVVAALNNLDETARACLLLRTVMDMPYREISLALDIPEGTAMSHVHRARRQLRDTLDPAPRAAVPSGEGTA
jgi:RNA polymerase sigma-70 factor (ECF subfamily)